MGLVKVQKSEISLIVDSAEFLFLMGEKKS